MNFEQFKVTNIRYPKLLYPVIQLQKKMREKTLGIFCLFRFPFFMYYVCIHVLIAFNGIEKS
jgi:hypothetical protein